MLWLLTPLQESRGVAALSDRTVSTQTVTALQGSDLWASNYCISIRGVILCSPQAAGAAHCVRLAGPRLPVRQHRRVEALKER